MGLDFRKAVQERASGACEYCCVPDRFNNFPGQLDHIIAIKHRGEDSLANLAWSCFDCNVFKGPSIAGLDPETGELTRLFHPRRDAWHDHFAWNGALLVGLTSVGRSTIEVLRINLAERVEHRRALIAANAMVLRES